MQTVNNENIYTAWGMYDTTNSVIDIARENHALSERNWNIDTPEPSGPIMLTRVYSNLSDEEYNAMLASDGAVRAQFATALPTSSGVDRSQLEGYSYTTNLSSAISQLTSYALGMDYKGYSSSLSGIAGALIDKRNDRVQRGIENSKNMRAMRRMK